MNEQEKQSDYGLMWLNSVGWALMIFLQKM